MAVYPVLGKGWFVWIRVPDLRSWTVQPQAGSLEFVRSWVLSPKPAVLTGVFCVFLSFIVEGEVFKVKKSSQSRRLAKMLAKERKQKSKVNVVNNIKQQVPAPLSSARIYGLEDEVEIVYNGEDAEEMESDEVAAENESFKKILESGAIPDAAMIHAARKRRQMAREMGDFIPVDDTEQYKGTNSRLVRDDDNDRSDDDDDDDDEEEGGRLSFTVTTAAREREKVREAFLSAHNQRESESEHDEELKRWEEEQIRKGVSIPQIQPPQPEIQYYPQCYYTAAGQAQAQAQAASVSVQIPATQSYSVDDYSMPTPVQPVHKSVIPPNLPTETPTPEIVKQRLQARLTSLKDIHRAHQQEVERICLLLEDSRHHIRQLEEDGPGLARSFAFYQETRGYVTDLVECLDEKIVQINALERAMHNLLKLRAFKLVSRRQQDIKDQAEEFSKLSSKTLSTMMMDTLAREKFQVEDTAQVRRAAEREGRRSRRRKAREAKMSDLKHYEGMSSDDEETEADITRFYAERDRILRDAKTVFEDVVEEFSYLGCIKRHFEEWKMRYPDSYQEAYIGLCLPKVFNPIVRLQLLGWNPVQDGKSFEDMNWYETLMFYGFEESAGIDSLRRDNDANLVPMVVDRIVIPKMTGIVEDVWDPMSTSQTLRLVRLIKKLVEEYPTVSGSSKNTKSLLQAVVTRIRKTLDEDIFVPLYPKTLLENTSLGANAFFQRQFWSCVKLLHNILSWQGILADPLLQELALDCLLNRYILLALQSWPGGCDMDRCQMIASVFPRFWFTRLLDDHTLPQLEMFCRYLKNAASTLDKQTVGPLGLKVDSKDSLKDIIKILVNIRAMDHALSLANQFSLKDLKSLVSQS